MRQHNLLDLPRSDGEWRRSGVIAVLAAIMATFMIALLAFSIDVGYLCMARSQAQHCADAAALAAALEMTSNDNLKNDIQYRITAATQKAIECAAMQDIAMTVQRQSGDGAGSVIDEVLFGRLENPDNSNEAISFADPNNPNVVYVRVSCDPAKGTAVPLFFARIFGMETGVVSATAVAAFSWDRTAGFIAEPEKPNTLMPFAISEEDWNNYVATGTEDNWTYDPRTKTVTAGPDGIPELKLFPDYELGQKTVPGNFGTVDIGSDANSTARLIRQILYGPTPEDLVPFGDALMIDSVTGTVELVGVTSLDFGGDTGISAGMKSALEQIIGDPKTIMIYNNVEGPGNNAVFTIVKFVGVRVLDHDLTTAAKKKQITIQPAIVLDNSTVDVSDSDSSVYVGKPIRLVR
ncbi:MAG TPA: hypothetical protein DD670_04410 [Planctomycetaceae bacterium]|nr:hypothetical protein [Planctomycetaceae bacterium]